ncbi:MAG: hypothetical protein LDL31_06460 [Prosthecobacter sp.]|nr:hypothetical protein [Prosthecobacter sp.]
MNTKLPGDVFHSFLPFDGTEVHEGLEWKLMSLAFVLDVQSLVLGLATQASTTMNACFNALPDLRGGQLMESGSEI